LTRQLTPGLEFRVPGIRQGERDALGVEVGMQPVALGGQAVALTDQHPLGLAVQPGAEARGEALGEVDGQASWRGMLAGGLGCWGAGLHEEGLERAVPGAAARAGARF
jgi:hypothetical protein